VWSVAARVALLAALVACGGDEEPKVARIVDRQVQVGTDLGLFDLSIAEASSGTTVVSWNEGDFGQGDPAWLALGDTSVQRAVFDPPEVGRVLRRWGALVATDAGFVRYEGRFGELGTWRLSELQLDGDGAFVAFRARPTAAVRLLTELEALAFGDRPVLFVVDDAAQIVLEVRTAGEDEPEPAVVIDPQTPARWALEAAKIDAVTAAVAWQGFSEEPSLDDVRQHLAWIDGLPDAPVATVVHGQTRAPGELLDLGATPEGIATLWLTPAGGVQLFVTASREEMDLSRPVVDTADEAVQSPTLLATADRLVLTWRSAAGEDTRAVVVDPATGAATEPFTWPLAAEDGPVATAPIEHGLRYAQVAACENESCGEHWLATGTVSLAY